VVLRNDLFYDERLLAGLIRSASENAVLMHPLGTRVAGGRPVAVAGVCDRSRLREVLAVLAASGTEALTGMKSVGILDLAPAYDAALRKVAEPFVYPATSPAKDLTEIENGLFAASYKGVTDLVTKWVFPIPAREVVRVLARFHVHPNTVTAASYGLVGLATWLFAEGAFAAGLCVAWVMTFLDTVDGKLARCTLTSTRFGNVFDHGLDLVHPPIWWAAWGIGLPGGIASNLLTFWIVVVGYVVGRLLEGAFTWAFGIQFFVWRPFDAFFRQIIARRNPNLILLTLGALAGSPDWGFRAVAVWTLVSIAVAATRNVQAHLEVRRGGEIRSWLDASGPGDARGAPGSDQAPPISGAGGISLRR
jgi:phosphatidylglycerophosphate synthase